MFNLKSPRHRQLQQKQLKTQPEDLQTIMNTKRSIFEFQQELEAKERLQKQQEQQQQLQRSTNTLTPILIPELASSSVPSPSGEMKTNNDSFGSPAITQRKTVGNNNKHNDLRRFIYASDKVNSSPSGHAGTGNTKFALFPSPFMIPSPRTPTINQII